MKASPPWTIRTFQALDEPDTCNKFVEAHHAALGRHGVAHLEAADSSWTTSRAVSVAVVEMPGLDYPVAGLRIHEPGWHERLPFERAVSRVVPNLWQRLEPMMPPRSGEICALFRGETPGHLSRSALKTMMEELAVEGLRFARQAHIDTLWGIAPRHTAGFWYRMGYRSETRFGAAAHFDYPDDRYPCQIVSHDLRGLSHVPEELRRKLNTNPEPIAPHQAVMKTTSSP